MSILIGVGIVTTVGVIYVGKKGWQALHKAVGITPGVLVYQDPNRPLSLVDMSWRQLNLNQQHLAALTQEHLSQLQRIDAKVAVYTDYQQSLQPKETTSAITEQQFVLQKLLHTRLPEMLASHYYLIKQNVSSDNIDGSNKSRTSQQREAQQLLQAMLDNIETRLESLLAQMDSHHLQDLRVMKNYIDSHS